MRRWLCSFSLTLGACFTTDLDPDLPGVFACTETEPCPGQLICVNARCEEGPAPRVEIRNPEEEEAKPFDDPSEVDGDGRTITMTFGGTLDLVDPSENAENVFGEGHLEVFVDDRSVGTIEAGALSGGVTFDIQVPNVIGPVRVSVRALRNDGSRYDNPEAVARRLFWIDDGTTPLVGITNPWPGASFPLDAPVIPIEAKVLHFNLQPANPNGMSEVLTGHVHIYYDVDLDSCLSDTVCDDSYITTVVGLMASQATIPDSSAGAAKLSAVLRNINHSLFNFPEGTEGRIDDEIAIVRE
ncbi:MAG: hypothetical protein IAG13_09320 [Deltaproteobacteria bacterium]|nr:hypothetical protein [Nannocystaceae bacterium]